MTPVSSGTNQDVINILSAILSGVTTVTPPVQSRSVIFDAPVSRSVVGASDATDAPVIVALLREILSRRSAPVPPPVVTAHMPALSRDIVADIMELFRGHGGAPSAPTGAAPPPALPALPLPPAPTVPLDVILQALLARGSIAAPGPVVIAAPPTGPVVTQSNGQQPSAFDALVALLGRTDPGTTTTTTVAATPRPDTMVHGTSSAQTQAGAGAGTGAGTSFTWD